MSTKIKDGNELQDTEENLGLYEYIPIIQKWIRREISGGEGRALAYDGMPMVNVEGVLKLESHHSATIIVKLLQVKIIIRC